MYSVITFFIKCGFSSSGRAPPCQGGGSEFEPRNPLQKYWGNNPGISKSRSVCFGIFFLYADILNRGELWKTKCDMPC